MPNRSNHYKTLQMLPGLLILCVSVAFIFISLALAVRYQGFWHHDSAVFLSVGRFLSQGYAPYVGVWDHKPPLIYFITAIGYLITPASPIGACIVFWLIGFISALFWIDTFKISGATIHNAKLMTLLSYSVLLFFNHEWHLMTETLAFFLSTMALNFALRSRIHQSSFYALLAGAFIGLSSLSKQQMVFDGLALSVILIWPFDKGHIKRFLKALLAGISVYVFIILVLWRWGCLSEAIYSYLFNFHYAPSRQFGRITTGHSLNSVLLLFAIGLFGLGYSALKTTPWKMVALRATGLILWLGGAMLVATAGHQHYNIVLWSPAVFALAMGIPAFNRLIDWEKIASPFECIHIAISYLKRRIGFVGIYLILILAVLGISKFWMSRHYSTARKLNWSIGYEQKPTVFIYSFKSPKYFALENIRPASKYIYLVAICYDFHRDKMIKEIKESFETNAPDYILINKRKDFLSKCHGAEELKKYLFEYIKTNNYVRRKKDNNFFVFQNPHAE